MAHGDAFNNQLARGVYTQNEFIVGEIRLVAAPTLKNSAGSIVLTTFSWTTGDAPLPFSALRGIRPASVFALGRLIFS
jgi:hypothetical protein